MSDTQFAAADDLDLRAVRFFTTVAETRHFGRAAAELHIAQPYLSRQIRGLEQQTMAKRSTPTPRQWRSTAGSANAWVRPTP